MLHECPYPKLNPPLITTKLNKKPKNKDKKNMTIQRQETKKNLVFDFKKATVVPGKIAGENKTYELKGIDLAMKLHYIKGLYFFNNTNVNNTSNNNDGISSFWSVNEMKNVPMYDWLVSYFVACGRIRESSTETGDRPSIKLNDAGIRVVEARSSKTVDEWLDMEDMLELQDQLIYDHTLGPDLPFSPLVCLQVTWFKCGGISVGLSWAHILGDAISASEFMNTWSQYMQGHHQQPKILALQDPSQPKYKPLSPFQEPTSVKRVNPVGNHWVNPTNCKIGTHIFHLTPQQLDQLHLKVHGSKVNHENTNQCFEVITSILWKSIAKIRNDLETKRVTICRPKARKENGMPYNGQVLGTIEAKVTVSSVDPLELVHLIAENEVDESNMVEELVNQDMNKFDYIVYGTSLTFVDMEQADVYGFGIKGNRPTFACYTIDGVEDKGSVSILPGKNDGKLIVLHLDEGEIGSLKHELNKEWSIA